MLKHSECDQSNRSKVQRNERALSLLAVLVARSDKISVKNFRAILKWAAAQSIATYLLVVICLSASVECRVGE